MNKGFLSMTQNPKILRKKKIDKFNYIKTKRFGMENKTEIGRKKWTTNLNK